jgi:hypothetical protein
MNLALLQGLLEGAGLTGTEVRMDPAPGRCCVAVAETPASSKTNSY